MYMTRGVPINGTMDTNRSSDYVIGVDLGGTKISAAAVNGNGAMISKVLLPTEAFMGSEHVMDQVIGCIIEVIQSASAPKGKLTGIGISSPGQVDPEDGVIIQAPNLSWKDVKIAHAVKNRFKTPCFIDNDANLGALAEYKYGAGKGYSNMIYITVSTGIGSGLILGGKLYHGAQGRAGEFGHITMIENGPLCSCGKKGCLEAVASGTAIARLAKERAMNEGSSLLLELSGGDYDRITAQTVAEADAKGDEISAWAIDYAVKYLGLGLAGLVNILNPDAFVIGGGVSRLGDRLFEPLHKVISMHAMGDLGDSFVIKQAQLGDDSCLLGAIDLVNEKEGFVQ